MKTRRCGGCCTGRFARPDPTERALAQSAERLFDLVIVDVDATAVSGIHAIRLARASSPVPILAVSAKTGDDVAVEALESGADDFLRKPFSLREMRARTANAMRRRAREQGQELKIVTGDLEIDLLHRRIRSRDQEVRLPAKLYEVLRKLAENAGKVVTHEEILRTVWGPDQVDRLQYLRVAIRSLRGRLEANPSQPCHILTEARIGYRLEIAAPRHRTSPKPDRPSSAQPS